MGNPYLGRPIGIEHCYHRFRMATADQAQGNNAQDNTKKHPCHFSPLSSYGSTHDIPEQFPILFVQFPANDLENQLMPGRHRLPGTRSKSAFCVLNDRIQRIGDMTPPDDLPQNRPQPIRNLRI